MPLTKITTSAITDAAVTEDKLGSSSVTEAKIGSSAVTSAKISDGTIANADISPSANIAESKLSVGDLSSKVARNESNIGLLGFKMAVNDGLTVFNLVDGIVDEFNDQSGVSTPQNSNQTYCATGDFYTNTVTCCSVPATQELTNYTSSSVGPSGTVSGTFTADPAAAAYNVLIVGGGGGSGSDAGGGGGAGGLVYIPHYPVTGGASYSYQAGTGGYGSVDPSSATGADGTNSEFNEIIALGGGGGGGRFPGSERTGNDGGSGGGSTEPTPGNSAGLQPQQSGDAGTYGFGNGGGSSPGGSHGGGGGGAGGSGSTAPSPDGGGPGGNGRDYTIIDGSTSVEYAAGGGGGSSGGPQPAGSAGGPSAGAGSTSGNGQSATASRGGGGGGGTNVPSGKGGNGGPGIVAFQLSKTATNNTTTTLTSAPFGVADSSVPTTARIVLFAEFNDTTETLNTDVIAKVSRDNGANYTNVTLSDAGYVAGTSGQKIYTGCVDVSGQPSGNEMRYQLAGANLSTEVKIHGVALQWT